MTREKFDTEYILCAAIKLADDNPMIKEEYVQYETAKLLKAAGFPKDGCKSIYSVPTGKRRNGAFGREDICEYIPKPTQSQSLRWLREDKKCVVTIYTDTRCVFFSAMGIVGGDSNNVFQTYDFDTYEAAAEAGIQAACKYLIDKNKKQ